MDILNPFEPESGEMPDFSESSRSNSTPSKHHTTTSSHRGSSGYSDEMVFVGHAHDDDDDPALWIYKINTLHQWVEVVATLFMVLTVAMMFNQIGLHLAHNQHPGFRTYTVRILLMVPIYSVTSYLGLHNPSNALIYAMIRDCYECVVLFSFLQYCLTYLGGPENIARYMLAKQHDEAVQIVTETDRIQKRRASEVAELGFASHLTPDDLYENGDEEDEEGSNADSAAVDDSSSSSKSSARKLFPEKSSAKPQVRSASPASSSSARSDLIGETLSSATAGFFSDAGKGDHAGGSDEGTGLDGDDDDNGTASNNQPKLTWQQRSMKFLGCGHKAKKKIQSHVHHGRFCFALCPCCPVWRPRSCELRRPWALGAEFLRLAILGTLQYIPWSLFVTALGLWGHHHGYYHEGRFALNDLYLYCVIIKNWSQCWALYCLGLFYLVMHGELAAIRPVFKFSMIKVVVILMWDQQVLVAYLEKSTTMKEADDGLIKRGWTSSEVGFCIQNFLCLLEMFFIGIGMAYAFHYTEWASPEVYETDRKVGPLCAFWRGKAVNTTKDLVHDLTSLTHGTVAATKYVVSPETWQKFGKGLSTSGRGKRSSADNDNGTNKSGTDANGLEKTTTAKGGYSRVASGAADEPDPEAPLSPSAVTPSKRRNTFVMLPRLMTSNDFKVSARFVESVSFMDVLHATREINVLERQLKAEKDINPESLFDDEAQKRFGVGTAAAQTVKSFLATQGVYHEEDLLEVGNHNLPQLLQDAAATGSKHRLTPQQVKKLERWISDLNQRQSSSASESTKR